MKTLTLTDEDYATVLDALDTSAEDYAYRADFEERHGDPNGEAGDYIKAANRFSDLRSRLVRMEVTA